MRTHSPSHQLRSAALNVRPRFGLFLVACGFATIALRAWYLAAENGAWETLVDFHAFYVSGKLLHEGLIDTAYNLATMLEAQRAFAGSISFMPWTYPPPFNLVVGLLAALPFVTAYILFTGATFSGYALVLYRMSPRAFPFALWLGVTSSIVMIICGQNGFLTASLIGLFCIHYVRSSLWAGVILGLMIIKPHMAVGLGLWLLFRKDFTTLLAAAAVALALSLAATFVMGPSVWLAFLAATTEASAFLKEGLYPLYRMTSVYAGLRSAGAPAGLAMGFHLAFAAAAVGVIFLARQLPDVRSGLGVALMASFFISPYAYDYDLPLLAVALTLLWPRLSQDAPRHTIFPIIGLSWVAGACGLLSFLSVWAMNETDATPVALGWLAMVALAYVTLRGLRMREGSVLRAIA